jgi:hypothetical protein
LVWDFHELNAVAEAKKNLIAASQTPASREQATLARILTEPLHNSQGAMTAAA